MAVNIPKDTKFELKIGNIKDSDSITGLWPSEYVIDYTLFNSITSYTKQLTIPFEEILYNSKNLILYSII
ncbi:MAG TPA: hypothetical protein GXX15_00165 [Clostridia bacterium]|nr:hypothetical protein [Clostridia bacterium]